MKYLLGIDVGTTGTKSLLFSAEGALLVAIHYIYNRCVVDVAESILGEHKMVARIDIAIMLYGCCVTAIFRHCADARWRTNPILNTRAIGNM